MFVSSQHFPCSRGHGFVGSVIDIILINIKQIIVYNFLGMYIVNIGPPQIITIP